VYAVLLLVAVLIVWWFLRNSTLAARIEETSETTFTLRSALRHRSYVAALGSSFANGWAVFGVRVSLVPLFVEEVLHRDGAFAGTALAVFAAGNVAMLMFGGRLADTWGRKPTVLIGLVVASGGTLWVGFTADVPMFLLATVVAGLGAGLLSPPLQASVADVIGSRGRGGPVLATFQMAADVGTIVGPIVTGLLADHLSYTTAFTVTGVLGLVAALAWLPAPETRPDERPEGPLQDVERPEGVLQGVEPEQPVNPPGSRSEGS
jgi:MFS family permease